MKHKTSKQNKKQTKKENIKISILVLLLLQYGTFSYKCHISWCDAYWRGAALLGRRFTSMQVLKSAAKILLLLHEM